MDIVDDRQLNPWLSIWTKPRATIQQIVDTNPEYLVLVLAGFSGIAQSIQRAGMRSMGDSHEWPGILMISAILGPIGGLISLYVGGFLIEWTGRWLGGAASSINIRAAIAWSSIPVIFTLVLLVPELLLFGQELFTSEMPITTSNSTLFSIFMVFAFLEMVLGFWTIVIFLKCLGQVQGFSAWSALGNIFLAALVIAIPLVIIAIIIGGMLG